MIRRVLAVDDEPVVLAVIKDILTTAGYTITTVTSGAEALRTLEIDTFDVVITDLRMPEMSGQELITQLRQNPTHRKTPIVVLATDADRYELDHLRVDLKLSKPFAPRALLNGLNALIG